MFEMNKDTEDLIRNNVSFIMSTKNGKIYTGWKLLYAFTFFLDYQLNMDEFATFNDKRDKEQLKDSSTQQINLLK